ncbi:energy transducer TonB [Thermodesulfobacteriota bacterium]
MTRSMNSDVFTSCVSALAGVSLTCFLFVLIPFLSSVAERYRLEKPVMVVELVRVPPSPPVKKKIQISPSKPLKQKIKTRSTFNNKMIVRQKIQRPPQPLLPKLPETSVFSPAEEIGIMDQDFEVSPESEEAVESVEPSQEEVLPVPVPFFKLTAVPQFRHREVPVFPDEMKQLGRTGLVRVEALIDALGRVRDVRILQSAGESFDREAIIALRNSMFTPGEIDGRPVAVLYRTQVRFRLQ